MRTHLFNKRKAREYFASKLEFTVGPFDVDEMIRERQEVTIVDVRRREDYLKGHIPHAISLPKEEWETCRGLTLHRPNVLYCYNQQCHAAARASLFFAHKGFPVRELEGGWKAWQESGFAVELLEEQRRAA